MGKLRSHLDSQTRRWQAWRRRLGPPPPHEKDRRTGPPGNVTIAEKTPRRAGSAAARVRRGALKLRVHITAYRRRTPVRCRLGAHLPELRDLRMRYSGLFEAREVPDEESQPISRDGHGAFCRPGS